MNVILVIYTVVAMGAFPKYDWRPLGEFKTLESCKQAANSLGIETFRCLSK